MTATTQSHPKTAVIILNWNGAALLRRFLPSVTANTPPQIADVIVADNGSTDSSLKILAEEFPSVKVIRFPENLGFAEGYNRAVALCSHYEFTVLLNSDVETPQGWLRPLVSAMEADPRLGACQPKILSCNEPGKFEYAGAAGGFIDRNGFPYCRGRLFSSVEPDNGQYDRNIPVFWATGAALTVRTQLYLETGGLDKAFFAHMEEIDLCWRIHLAGYRIEAVPQSRVFHLGGGSLPASDPRKTYLNFRNNLLLLHKNLPVTDVAPTLLRRRLLDTVAWLKFILTFDFSNAAAILKAHRDFRKMRRAYTSHPTRNLLREFPICRRNILIDYYLRGKRRFSDLGFG
ncbi:MAG: glycosyltransferase family 2 protein, partial [Muribaculaceae bacterium]|nr:glycosyltransferase family 2 protein [Muribaculaceae bacterium]